MKNKASIFGFLFVITLVFSFALIPGGSKPNQANPTIKIGALGPLLITPGADMKKGAELAVKEINDAGGFDVGGTTYDFELIVETTSDPTSGLPEPAVGTASLNKLQLQDDVVGIVGGFRTEVVVQLQAILDRPFLGVGSTAPIITPFFWRTSPTNGSGLTRMLLDLYALGMGPQMGVRNVTIVREDATWSLAMSIGLKYYLNLALPVAMGALGVPRINFTDDIVIPTTHGLDGVISAMTPIKSSLPETNTGIDLDINAIMHIFSGPVGKYVPQAWASLDMDQILAGINVESQASTYFDSTQGASYGEIELETAPPDLHSPSMDIFRANYNAEYGEEPTYTSVASYDSVFILKEAIQAAGVVDSIAVQLALNQTEYQGTWALTKFTNEPNVWTHPTFGYPYGQVGYDNDGNRVLIPGVPTDLIVHDLYTPLTVGVRGRPYAQGYFCQWQKGGVKRTVWMNFTSIPMTENLTTRMEWPIVHSDSGYVPTTTTEDTSTTTGATSTTTEATTTTTTTEVTDIPGFEFTLVLVVVGTFAMLYIRRKRKKR